MSDDELHRVFRALADASRRRILDLLRDAPGLSVGEVAEQFAFSRFAVMKHLRLLEEANLLQTRKEGRYNRLYLNSIPIQMIQDRWITRYSRHWSRSLTRLKYSLEEKNMNVAVRQVYTVYIRTTEQALWDALVQAELTPEWFGGMSLRFEPRVGAELHYTRVSEDGQPVNLVGGRVIEFQPPKRISYSFKLLCEPAAAADRESRVSYELESQGELMKLTVIHDDFDAETATFQGTSQGWPRFLSNLKTWLETGRALQFPTEG